MTPETPIWNGIEAPSIPPSIPLSRLRGITTPRAARKALNLTLAEMGALLGAAHPNGHGGAPFNKGAVWAWENYPTRSRAQARKFKITRDTREAYRRIVEAATRRGDPHVARVTLRGVRVWHFVVWRACAECGKVFALERSNQKRCRRCKGNDTTNR